MHVIQAADKCPCFRPRLQPGAWSHKRVLAVTSTPLQMVTVWDCDPTATPRQLARGQPLPNFVGYLSCPDNKNSKKKKIVTHDHGVPTPEKMQTHVSCRDSLSLALNLHGTNWRCCHSCCNKAMSGLSVLCVCVSATHIRFHEYVSITRYKQEKQVQLVTVFTHLICTRVTSQVRVCTLAH